MATVHTPPIDLYAESREGFEQEHWEQAPHDDPQRARPAFNGDRDDPAIEEGPARLDRVLGW